MMLQGVTICENKKRGGTRKNRKEKTRGQEIHNLFHPAAIVAICNTDRCNDVVNMQHSTEGLPDTKI